MNALISAAAWVGDTAARIAIRVGAGVQLAAALAKARRAPEPEVHGACAWDDKPTPLPAEHRPSWAHDFPPPRPVDQFAEIRDASEDDIKDRLQAIYLGQGAIQRGEQQ